MYGTLPLSGPGNGIFPPTVEHRKIRNATAATAFTIGSCVMLDIQATRVTSVVPGHATAGVDDSIFNCCILPTTQGIAAGNPLFICEEAIAAGAVGKASLMALPVTAKAAIASGDIAVGAALIAQNGSDLLVSSAGVPALAFAVSSVGSVTATSGSTQTVKVWFNGAGHMR